VIVEVRPDKEQKTFIVNVGDKQIRCKHIRLDEELYSFDEEVNEFDAVFVEARYVKLSQDTCVIETRIIEVAMEDNEE